MIAYLLQLTIVWGVLYALYYLFLRKLTFFAANRFFLLASLVVGLWLPTLDIDWAHWLPLTEDSATPTYLPTIPVDWQQLDRPVLPAEVVVTASDTPPTSSPLPDWPWYYYVYVLGLTLAMSRLIAGLCQMQRLYLEGTRHYARDYVRVDHEAVSTPFSFFRYIFWSPRLDYRSTDGQRILQHERAHGRLGHSWDIVLLETLQILGWFHPLLFLYRRSLRQIHEYQADAAVLRETAVRTYGTMLLRQAQGKGQPAFLAHPFSNTQLKNRILMMTRTRSRYHQLWRFTLAVPLLLFLMVWFSNPGLSQEALESHNRDHGTIHIPHFEYDLKLAKEQVAPSIDMKASFHANSFVKDTFPFALQSALGSMQMGEKISPNQTYYLNVSCTLGADGKVQNISFDGDLPEDAFSYIHERLTSWTDWKPGTLNGSPHDTNLSFNMKIRYEKSAADYLKDQGEEVFMVVERMPGFKGTECNSLEGAAYQDCSLRAIYDYVKSNLQYPPEAKAKNLEGTVVADFVVKKDGTVFMPTIIEDIGSGAGEEVLRIVNNMPAWNPGYQRGRAVHTNIRLPVQFRLSDSNRSAQEVPSAKKPLDGEEVFMLVEDMPLFPGTTTKEESDKAVFQHVARNIKYPQVARENGVTGTNVVQFIVRKDGSVSDVELLRDIGAGTGAESIRVVESMPDGWTPGKQRGRAVNVQFRMPIRFKATEEHTSQIAIEEPSPQPEASVQKRENEEEIFMVAEQMPLFSGTYTKKESDKALFDFIKQNLRYPTVAKENGVEGIVIAQFVIRKDGTVSDVTLLRDIGAGAGEEAMRVIRNMPSWTPGKQKGKLVNVQYRIPVRFQLTEEVAAAPREINVNQINNTLSDEALTIFPNPSDGRVEMRFKEPLAAGDIIRLYNANGQFLRTESLGDQVGSMSRTMTIAQPGTYYLQLVRGTKILTKTVIIQ